MAATDIQYGGLEPVLYTPDFSFLKYVLDKSTSNYEKGLKSVSTAYGNLKKELSDPVNIQKRDQYLKDADDQLKKIASADLSLQENVNIANSIFTPLATDPAFVFDSYQTERINNERAKMHAWKNSDDLEVRKKYNPEIEEWLSRDLNVLKNGKGDVNNYRALKGRSAVAYMDPQELVLKFAKDQGFTYKKDQLGNGYFYTVEGGPEGRRSYEEFAKNFYDNSQVYKTQNDILAENKAEKALEIYRTDEQLAPLWANKTDDEIYKGYAANRWKEFKDEQQSYIDAQSKSVATESADIKAALNGPDSGKYIQGFNDLNAGNSESIEAKMALALKGRADAVNSLKGKLVDLQSDFDRSFGNPAKKDEFVQTFAANPKGYFSNLQLQNDITRFSNLRQASVKVTMKEDRTPIDWVLARNNTLSTLNNIDNTRQDNLRADEKLALEIQKEENKQALKGNRVVKNADGTTSIVPIQGGDIKPVDISATQLVVTQRLNNLKDNVAFTSAQALNSLTGVNGALSMLQPMGLDPAKVSIIKGMYTRYYNTQDKKEFKPSAEETQAMNEVSPILTTFYSRNNPAAASSDISNGPLTIDKLPGVLSKAMAGYNVHNQAEYNYKLSMGLYNASSELLLQQNAALEAGKKVVIDQVSSDPLYHDMFKWEKDKNGKEKAVDLIDENDIFKRLKDASIIEDTGFFHFDKKANLTDQDLRNISIGYIDGTLNVTQGGSRGSDVPFSDNPHYKFIYNDKEYKVYYKGVPKISHVEPFSIGNPTNPYLLNIYEYSKNNFPTDSKNFKKLMEKINERVPIPAFESAMGNVGASPFFDISGETANTILRDLSGITPTNSTIYDYSEGTYNASQLKDVDQQDFRKQIYEKNPNIVGITLFTSSPLNSGGQAVAIKFKPVEGTGGKDAPKWSGKTIYFPINVTPNSPEVFHIFENAKAVSVFEKYQREGKPYVLDAFQAEGVKAVIQPNQSGDHTGTVQLFMKPYNPVTQTYSDIWQKVETEDGKDLTYDLSHKTFPDLQSDIYNNFIYKYVSGKILYNKQKQANIIASGKTFLTGNDIYNTLIPR